MYKHAKEILLETLSGWDQAAVVWPPAGGGRSINLGFQSTLGPPTADMNILQSFVEF